MRRVGVEKGGWVEVGMWKMVDGEVEERGDGKRGMYVKMRKVRYRGVLEDVMCGREGKLRKDEVGGIGECGLIGRDEKLVIEGKWGWGKWLVACGVGREGCMVG